MSQGKSDGTLYVQNRWEEVEGVQMQLVISFIPVIPQKDNQIIAYGSTILLNTNKDFLPLMDAYGVKSLQSSLPALYDCHQLCPLLHPPTPGDHNQRMV